MFGRDNKKAQAGSSGSNPRGPMKRDSLQVLKNLNVPVGSVLDVGVQTCTAELLHEYAHVPHILMEPIAEWRPNIEKNYGNKGIDYTLLEVAASDENGEAKVKTSSVREDGRLTHARFDDTLQDGPDIRRVKTQTLDSIIEEVSPPGPYLLKIDVDGAEMKVLAGAEKTLPKCSVVIVEAGATNMLERCGAVRSAGFEIFDMVDLCYYNNRFVQADFVFLNRQTIADHNLQVYRDGFDLKKWHPYRV